MVFYIGAVQNSAAALRNDVARYRNTCVIEERAPHDVSLSFKNGITLVTHAHHSYPQTANGIIIVDITASLHARGIQHGNLGGVTSPSTTLSTTHSIFDASNLHAIKNDANLQGFSNLPQLMDYLEAKHAELFVRV